MDLKRVFRAPLFWVLAVIAITVLMFSFDSNGGYSKITTAQAEQLISDGKVDKAEIRAYVGAAGVPERCNPPWISAHSSSSSSAIISVKRWVLTKW